MNRSLWFFNLLLAVLAVVLGGAVFDSFTKEDPSLDVLRRPAGLARPELLMPGPETPAPPARRAVPPQSEFAILVQKDIFKIPVAEAPVAPVIRKPLPPPPPLPTLIGTVFVDDERRALLKDGKRTDMFAIGDEVAGGKLVQIDTDRVVIQRGDTPAEVWLKTSIQPVSVPGPTTSADAPTDEAAPGQSGTSPALPSVATPPVMFEAPPTEQKARGQGEGMTPPERRPNIRQQLQKRWR